MSVNKFGKLAVIGFSTAIIAGCSTTATETDSSASATESVTSSQAVQATDASGDQAYGVGQSGALSSVIVEEEATPVVDPLAGVETVFYFDFDQSIVRPESREALAKHAQFLVNNPDARAVLEGHADERGTREYNMALGERRAKAISRYLTIQGVSASQIETVSFGEEVPVAFGSNPSAWQLNRRVEVRYE